MDNNHISRFQALEALYSCYQELVDGLAVAVPLACGPGCHNCCTVNVTATTLEVRYLVSGSEWQEALSTPGLTRLPGDLYRPTQTANQFARSILARQAPEPDAGEHRPGSCPLLEQELCQVYQRRPFSCRAMTSGIRCTTGGEADMDPLLLEVNIALYQVIEHLDAQGSSGNLIDLLALELGDRDRQRYLCDNSVSPGFIFDPSHSGRARSFLRRLSRRDPGLEFVASLL